MAETKQGLEVIVKFLAGTQVVASAGYAGNFKPGADTAADVTFTYKRNVDWNWNWNVRPVHNAQGVVQHYKQGIPSGTLTLSAIYMDESDFAKLREAVAASSVPWGYLEIQYLDTTGATLEYSMQFRRIVLSDRSVSNPEDDSTASFSFILYECPTRLAAAAELLT
jgi:hypothetical protein